jgi:hypothetical protein
MAMGRVARSGLGSQLGRQPVVVAGLSKFALCSSMGVEDAPWSDGRILSETASQALLTVTGNSLVRLCGL